MLVVRVAFLMTVLALASVGLIGCEGSGGKEATTGEPRREFVEVKDEGQATVRAEVEAFTDEVLGLLAD